MSWFLRIYTLYCLLLLVSNVAQATWPYEIEQIAEGAE